MNKIDKKKLTIISLCLLLCIGFFSSVAYLIRTIDTDNVITFGNLKLQLINKTLDSNGKEVDVDKLEEKLSAASLSRRIRVKNICDNDMYVRVKVKLNGKKGDESFPVDVYADCNYNRADWQEKDGWWYYNSVLSSGKETENLLDTIEFNLNNLTSKYSGSKIIFNVEAQAVQSKNNGDSALNAEGWPEEVTN